jgi:hypothetical protein
MVVPNKKTLLYRVVFIDVFPMKINAKERTVREDFTWKLLWAFKKYKSYRV